MQHIDPLDELMTLHDSRGKLEETIAKVRSFPREVTRPCLVPLSRVAFLPGHFMHTNEFVVDLPEEDEEGSPNDGTVHLQDLQWTSHTQTASALQERLNKVHARIQAIENISMGKELEVLREVHVSAAAPSNALQPEQAPVQKRQQPAAVGAAVHNPPQSTASQQEQHDEGHALPFYEIREFEDQHGVVSSHEVLEMSQLMQEHGTAGSASVTASATAPAAGGVDAVEKALMDLESKFKSKQQTKQDPEVAFAAELLQGMDVSTAAASAAAVAAPAWGSSAAVALGNVDLDFLSALEQQEAAAAQKQREAQRMRRDGGKGKGGWAAGFLGGGGEGGGVPNEMKRSPAKNAVPAPIAAPAPVPVAASSPFGGPILEKNI